MKRLEKQFDPTEQFETAIREVDAAIFEIQSQFERVQWLASRIREQYAQMQQAADDFAAMTEAEAAAAFGIKETTFAHYRRKYDFPHVAFGTVIRFTPEHLREIAEILDVRRRRPAIRRAA